MGACFYVLYTQFKNRMKEKVKHVSFWLVALFVAAYFVLYFIQIANDIGETHLVSNAVPTFHAVATLVFGGFTFLALSLGIKLGSSFYRMSDVNLMFVSPVQPNRILMYGIMRQFAVSMIATFLLLMQLVNLRIYFGLWIREMAFLMIAWLMISLSCSILSLTLYSISSIHPRFRTFVLLFIYILAALVVAGLALAIWRSDSPWNAAISFFSDPTLHVLPIGGWTSGFLYNAMMGDYTQALLYAVLTLFLPLLGIITISRTGSDFYEDVLTSIGNVQTGSNASIEETAYSSGFRHNHVGKSHLYGKMKGPAVLLQRQMTEQRRSFSFFLDQSSLLVFACAALLGTTLHAFMLKGMYPHVMMVLSEAIMSYVLIATIATGRLVDELGKPFIYLIPGGAVKKLFFLSLPSVFKAFYEGLISFTILALFIHADIIYVLCATAFYTTTCMFFSSAYLTSVRAFGLQTSKSVRMALALVIITAVFLFELSYGVGIAERFGIVTTRFFPLTSLVLSVVNLIATVLFFNCAKGILDNRN